MARGYCAGWRSSLGCELTPPVMRSWVGLSLERCLGDISGLGGGGRREHLGQPQPFPAAFFGFSPVTC